MLKSIFNKHNLIIQNCFFQQNPYLGENLWDKNDLLGGEEFKRQGTPDFLNETKSDGVFIERLQKNRVQETIPSEKQIFMNDFDQKGTMRMNTENGLLKKKEYDCEILT